MKHKVSLRTEPSSWYCNLLGSSITSIPTDRPLNDRWQEADSGLTQYDIDARIVNTQTSIKMGFGMNSNYFLWGHESVMDKINKRNKHRYKYLYVLNLCEKKL